jgi:hypothetical protein
VGEASTGIHELDFCSLMASAANEIFKSDQNTPFSEARIEGLGSGAQLRKRKDLRFYGKKGGVVLTGEVKLPGTPQGQNPYDGGVVQDAQAKADDAGAQYFFTWNVNTFVLWNRYRQDVPLLERRVQYWPAGRYFRDAKEVGRAENLEYLRSHFLPPLLSDLGEICSGHRPEWSMAPDDLFGMAG